MATLGFIARRTGHGLRQFLGSVILTSLTMAMTLGVFGGFVMLLLGGFFFAGFSALEKTNARPGMLLGVLWLIVLLLLITLVVLAMIDLRLTRRLRRNREQRKESPVE